MTNKAHTALRQAVVGPDFDHPLRDGANVHDAQTVLSDLQPDVPDTPMPCKQQLRE